jgi:hypothetical protein
MIKITSLVNNYKNDSDVSEEVDRLIADLTSSVYDQRRFARRALRVIGKPAIGPLLEALTSSDDNLRWEAAKVLSTIRDPAVAPGLVEALGDDRFGVCWLAAEGLIVLERDAVPPLLNALIKPSKIDRLVDGAHHVFHELIKRRSCRFVKPVLLALDHEEPELTVPLAAYKVLNSLRTSGYLHS